MIQSKILQPKRAVALAFLFCGSSALAADLAIGSELGASEWGAGHVKGMRAEIVQSGDFNEALTQQKGLLHIARILQIGDDNISSFVQHGRANQATLIQSGAGNEVQLSQSGRGNHAHVEQAGNGQRALIGQAGNGNLVDIRQGPLSPDVGLQQHGNGLAARVIQY